MKKELSTNGFTMTDLVVTVALMGTLLSLVAPKFTNVSEETQGERNIANMHTNKYSRLIAIAACCPAAASNVRRLQWRRAAAPQ